MASTLPDTDEEFIIVIQDVLAISSDTVCGANDNEFSVNVVETVSVGDTFSVDVLLKDCEEFEENVIWLVLEYPPVYKPLNWL